jgi:hypothetical protein
MQFQPMGKQTMKRLALTAGFLATMSLGTGCVSHFSHSVSASASTQGTPVESEASGMGILMLTAPDLDASTELKAKCPSGKLSNVETQATMRNWFVVQAYSVTVKGICNP